MARHFISRMPRSRRSSGRSATRLSDGDGLYLRLFVNGGSHGWRFDYTSPAAQDAEPRHLPENGLSAARQKAEEARQTMREGIDPSGCARQARRRQKSARRRPRAEAGLPPVDSFEAIAREWYAKNAPSWAPSHSEKIIRRLELDVFPWIGAKPIASIRPADLLALFRRVESRGAIETTHRIQQTCSQVFRYAVATLRAEHDPSRDLRGALTPWKPQHYATLTDPRDSRPPAGRHRIARGELRDEVRDAAGADAVRAAR